MRCYNCGGEVLVNEESGIGICMYCAAEIPVPKETVAPERFEKANVLLSESRFDEAKEIFTELLIDNPFDAAVCWGLAVSEYGIEYVTDPASGELVPTLHRLSNTSFSDYIYTKQAIQYAVSGETKAFYEKQSRQIDLIQVESLQISSKEDPYDVFICYKRMEDGEKRTADARIAADYYKELTRRGYKVFFAEVTLTAGEEYEPRIFAALQSARVMIAIASKLEYYEAVWVRNEWSRYAVLAEEKPGERTLIPVYSHMTHDMLPEALKAQPQYVEMDSLVNPRQTLLTLVAEQFETGEAGDISAVRRQVKTEGYSRATADIGESAENYLVRATGYLASGEYSKAEGYFIRSNEMGESPEAYLGLMMCQLGLPGREALGKYDSEISGNGYFQKALACADGDRKEDLEAVAETCRRNTEWRQKCEQEFKDCSAKLENLLRSIQNKGRGVAGFETASAIDALSSGVRGLKATLSADWSANFVSRLWTIGINLIPTIWFLIRHFLGGEGAFHGLANTLIVIFGMIQMFGNGIMLHRVMRKKGILSGGFFKYIIRIGICIAFTYLVTMVTMNYPYVAFGVALVLSLVLLIRNTDKEVWSARGRLRRKKKAIKALHTTPEEVERSIPAAAEAAFNEIVAPAEQYHYYRQENEWNELIASMHKQCMESAKKYALEVSAAMESALK